MTNVAVLETPQVSNPYQLATVDKAKAFIDQNFSDQLSLSDIARHSNMSVFHFSRLFKKVTGYSPHQYLLYKRMDSAKDVLKDSELSITEAAHRTGFSSVEYFATVFRSQYGLNPTQYRRQIKNSSGFQVLV